MSSFISSLGSSLPASLGTATATLAPITTTATALGNLVLVTPSQTQGYQPQNAPTTSSNYSPAQQPPTFVFDFEGEQSVAFSSDITDHYIENNSAIQDQISLKPVVITTQGFVSELNDVVPPILQPLQTIVQKLSTVGAYVPSLSLTAQIAYNEAFFLYQTAIGALNSGISAWSSITGGAQGTTVISGSSLQALPSQNKQQTAFQLFYGYWVQRTLFTVQTPYAIFQNMAILSLRAVQDETTQSFSTFECSFKQIRTVQSAVTPPQSAVSQGRLSSQSAASSSLGTINPPDSTSLSSGISGSSFSSSLAVA